MGKKVIDTKESLASYVKEDRSGSIKTTEELDSSEERSSVVAGTILPLLVMLSLLPAPIVVLLTRNGVELHEVRDHEGPRKSDDPNEDLKWLIEVEVRRQIWPNHQSTDEKKILNVENVGK